MTLKEVGRGLEVGSARVPSYGGRGLAKRSYNFYCGWKSLIYSLFCTIYGICGVGWKCHIGEGLTETSKYRHMGRGLKIAQKPSYIWTSLTWLKRVQSMVV